MEKSTEKRVQEIDNRILQVFSHWGTVQLSALESHLLNMHFTYYIHEEDMCKANREEHVVFLHGLMEIARLALEKEELREQAFKAQST